MPPGPPAIRTTVTIGRTDELTQTGQVRKVFELVPRTDRDVMLARLSSPVTNIPPVPLAATAPTAGQQLKVAGYGRTTDEWSPEKLHVGDFTVNATTGSDVAVAGGNNAAVCQGDTGAPALRTTATGVELAALVSRSYQVGCYGTDTPAGTPNTAIATRVDDLRTWITDTVNAPRAPQGADFNCDGYDDVAIAAPYADVSGHNFAGAVHIVYGGGKGTFEIDQDTAGVPDAAEADDGFGLTLATYDRNKDDCTDLVVGIPGEGVDGRSNAGMVTVLFGAPAGLTKGPAALNYQQGAGSGDLAAAGSETDDDFGYALAAGNTTAGEPYLIIGVPYEDIGSGSTAVPDAGGVFYLRGSVSKWIQQGKNGTAGTPEFADCFGLTIAATPQHIAIGAPYEDRGSEVAAGSLQIFEHTLNSSGSPKSLGVVSQDTAGISGAPEEGDNFAGSLAGVPFHPAGSSAATDSVFFVGVPREDLTVDGVGHTDAGMVHNIRVTAVGAISEQGTLHQGLNGIDGGPESGDEFGQTLAAANVRPKEVTTAANLALAVGSPFEDLDGVADAGAIQTFAPLWSPGDSDVSIRAGSNGLPGSLTSGLVVGWYMQATGRNLYVGIPNYTTTTPYGAMHSLPWANIRGWPGTSTVTSYEPGKNGLPTATSDGFGYTMQ